MILTARIGSLCMRMERGGVLWAQSANLDRLNPGMGSNTLFVGVSVYR